MDRDGKPVDRVTRDRRRREDPHDPPVPETVVALRPIEASGHLSPRRAGVLPPPRSSPPPSPPGDPERADGSSEAGKPGEQAPTGRVVALKARSPRPVPGGPGAGGPAVRAAPPRHVPGAPRRLGVPVPVAVRAGAGGRPVQIGGEAVDAVRESWLIEDRWWTDRPLRRRYWEVVTTTGRDCILFRDLVDGRWYRQR